MAVIIGNNTNGGWSSVTQKLDSGTVGGNPLSWLNQFGTNYGVNTYNKNDGTQGSDAGVVGDGTRFMFFSAAGNDSNTGTLAAPKLSPNGLNNSVGNPVGIRDFKPDWMLLRKGDTFAMSSCFWMFTTGSVSDPTSYLQLLTGYDPGASNNPPLCDPIGGGVLPKVSLDQLLSSIIFKAQNGRALPAIMGIDFVNPLGDPTDATFINVGGGFALNTVGVLDSILIENCGFYWFGMGALFDSGYIQYPYFRRNRIRFQNGNGFEAIGTGIICDGNLLDGNAWDSSGFAVCTFTTSSTKITKSGGVPIPPNDCRIRFWAQGAAVLPTSIIQGQLYFVVNSGSPTAADFSVANTIGGSAITLTGSPSGTLRFQCPILDAGVYSTQNGRAHNIYNGGILYLSLPPAVGHGEPSNIFQNIFANDGSDTQNRVGGLVFNNFWLNNYGCHNMGAPIAGKTHLVSYNVELGGGDSSNTLSSAVYQYDLYNLAPINYDHNIAAHTKVAGGGGLDYGYRFTGGVRSNNIVYKWGSYPTIPPAKDGATLTFSINAAGSGCDGRMMNFSGYWTPGSGGGSCVANIVGGAGGIDGSYTGVSFTGGTGTGLVGDVTVAGGVVTAVSLTSCGDMLYTSADQLTSGLTGLPAGWSFKFYPYIVELREGGTGWTTQDGTGAQAYCVPIGGSIVQSAMVDNTTRNMLYTNTSAAGGGAAANLGGVRLIPANPGTHYSSGQVVAPFSLISGPPGKHISDLPTGFALTVGPYPAISSYFDSGLALSNPTPSGTGTNGSVLLFFTTTGGVSTITSAAAVLTEIQTVSTPSGSGYTQNDVCDVANYAGVTGVKVKLDTVSTNVDAGNNIYDSSPAGHGWFAPERTAPDYYVSIGQPGGFQATDDGLLNAIDLYQRKGTWQDNLGAPAINRFIRIGFNMGEPGVSSNQLLMAQACL